MIGEAIMVASAFWSLTKIAELRSRCVEIEPAKPKLEWQSSPMKFSYEHEILIRFSYREADVCDLCKCSRKL